MILITGARGLLGQELTNFLKSRSEKVVEWDLPENDITNVEKAINGIHQIHPDIIFHLAAWTDVDGCEEAPAKAMAVNFQGTWAIALGAAEIGCPLVYISTDYVFDGNAKRPYRENDKPNPLSVYGRTKFMGEQVVLRSCKKSFIVRTSWLYGKGGRNFVDTIRAKAQKEPVLRVVNDQVGSPTYARDLCLPLWEIAQSKQYGIYHLTNSGQCSWFEFACEIVRLTQSPCQVLPITTEESGRRAPRPKFSVLDNHKFQRRFKKTLRPWQEALRSYL